MNMLRNLIISASLLVLSFLFSACGEEKGKAVFSEKYAQYLLSGEMELPQGLVYPKVYSYYENTGRPAYVRSYIELRRQTLRGSVTGSRSRATLNEVDFIATQVADENETDKDLLKQVAAIYNLPPTEVEQIKFIFKSDISIEFFEFVNSEVDGQRSLLIPDFSQEESIGDANREDSQNESSKYRTQISRAEFLGYKKLIEALAAQGETEMVKHYLQLLEKSKVPEAWIEELETGRQKGANSVKGN